MPHANVDYKLTGQVMCAEQECVQPGTDLVDFTETVTDVTGTAISTVTLEFCQNHADRIKALRLENVN